MNHISNRLDKLKQSWIEQPDISKNLSLMGLTDINKQQVTDTLADLARMAAKLNDAPSENMVMTLRSCEEMLQVAESYFKQHLKDHDSIHMLGFLTLLKQIRVTLVGALAQYMLMNSGNKPDKAQAA